jgi:glycosyltransferase involved in cell wall biosynthesis
LIIAMVCDGVGEMVAGSFISTMRFAELLSARGHRIVLVSSGPFRRRHDRQVRGMPIYRFPGVVVPWTDGRLYLGVPGTARLREIFSHERVDVVHVMLPLPLGLAAVRLARAMAIPLVVHSHIQPENIFSNSPAFPGRAALRERFCAYLDWLYRQADVMIYPSEFSRKKFPKLAGHRSVVISNGVDRRRFHPAPSDPFTRRFALSAANKNLLYLGRLHREKNVATLIRAMPLILRRHPDAHLFIVGRGYEQPILRRLAQDCGAASEVVFCGYLPDDELAAAYNACDLFVFPSFAELEGMVVLEAMACGKPLLVADSDESAATGFIHDNGVLFKAADPNDLAAQANSLLENVHALRDMGRRSLQLSERFEINESAAALEVLYYSLLETDRSSPCPHLPARP